MGQSVRRPRGRLAAAMAADVVVTIALCVVRVPGWRLNPCVVAAMAFGSTTVDLIALVIARNGALVIFGPRAWWWAHLTFVELTYAMAKAVARGLGVHGACDDSNACFVAACLAFAAGAYLGPTSVVDETPPGEASDRASLDGLALPLLSGSEEEEAADKAAKSSWRELAALARPDSWLFCCAMILAVCAALATSAISLWTGDALDILIKVGSGRRFKRQLEQLAMIALIGAVCTGGRGGLFSVIGVRVNRRIRDRLFRHLLTLELGFFDATSTGELNSRLSSDTAKIGDQVSLNVNVFARTGVQLATTLGFMIHSSPALTYVACASVPLVGVATKRYGAYVWALSKKMQDRLADAMRVAEEALSSMPTVRSMAAEPAVAADLTGALDAYASVGFAQARAYACWQSFNTALPNLVTLLLLYDGGRLVDKDALSGGRLVAFMLLTQSLSDSFNTLADMYSNISEAFGAADKVFELMRRTPGPGAPTSPYAPREPPQSPHNAGAKLALADVHFRYPARPEAKILDGLDLAVDAGSFVALVGPSGSGKSSVLALLQAFYAPERGRVSIDGVDVANYAHRELHRLVATVGQEPVLFARSVERNVAYGLDDVDVEDALRKAHAWDFVAKLPAGLETHVGERGAQMSGGQKQRLAIARALARRPRLLLLDEATSALDSEAETKVQASLDAIIANTNMTVLVIAHRLSTVQHADRICVVLHGKVREDGDHASLLATPGSLYADLVKRQQAAHHASLRSPGSPGSPTSDESVRE